MSGTQTATKTAARPYVMKGAYAAKALDTYHLILAPTFACNIRCTHCYLPDHDTEKLPAERVLRLIDEWSEIVLSERGRLGGIFHVKGGEPLILHYFSDILARLVELRTLQFMMTTNGILGTSKIVANLHELDTALEGGVTVIVSLDGSHEETHAMLRGPGNFDRPVAFVRALRDAGINVFLNNVVHEGNLDDIPAFVDLALDLDVAQVNFLSFIPKGFGEAMVSDRAHPIAVFENVREIWQGGDGRVRRMLAGSLCDILHDESRGICTSCECVGGYRGMLYIIPDGTAYSCPQLNHPGLSAGNILSQPLATIHDALRAEVYAKVRTPAGETRDRYLCKGEKYLPLSGAYVQTKFAEFQDLIDGGGNGDGTSYCFSRNW